MFTMELRFKYYSGKYNTVTTNAITNAEVTNPSNASTSGTSIQTMATHQWTSTGAETFAAISFTRTGSGRAGNFGALFMFIMDQV